MFEAAAAIIAGILRVGVPIYIAAIISTSIILFLPRQISDQIGIEEFRHLYKGYLGSSLILSISLLFASGLAKISQTVSNSLDDRRLNKMTMDSLRMLTESEKDFLKPFIVEGKNTVFASISDGVAGGLAAKKLVYRASNIIQSFNIPYNLQPIARKTLSKHPDLLN